MGCLFLMRLPVLRDSIKSFLNNINRDYNHLKIIMLMDKDWEHRFLKSVMLEWWDYVKFFL